MAKRGPPFLPSSHMTSATAAATAEGRNLELERARVHGFIYGVLWEPDRPGRELTWEDLDGALLDPDAVLWLHFNAANAHAREWLSQCPRLPEALRRFLVDRDDRKRLDLVAEGIIGVISVRSPYCAFILMPAA